MDLGFAQDDDIQCASLSWCRLGRAPETYPALHFLLSNKFNTVKLGHDASRIAITESKMCIRLYYSNVSPFSRKVRLAALFAGLRDQIDMVEATVSPIRPNMDLAPLNPLIKLPVLVTAVGVAIYDSPVICEYLNSIGAHPKLIPRQVEERWRVLTLQALCDGILDAAVLANQERMLRPEPIRWETFREAQLARIERGLKALSAQLPAMGNRFGVDAISAICVFGYLDLRHAEFDWRSRVPNAAAWMAELADHPFVIETAHPA